MSTAELKQLIESIAISQRETDRVVKETSLSIKDTDRQMKETERIVKETSLSIKDTDRQMKETERKLKELGKQIGGLGNKFGAFAEGLAFSSIECILRADFGMVAYVEGRAAARQAVLAHGWHLVHAGEDLFDLKNPPGFVPKIYRADAR